MAGAVAALAALTTVVATRVSPWPAALLIRAVFERGARQTIAEMERHPLPAEVTVRSAIPYALAGAPVLDLVRLASEPLERPLPVVVWIHGGAWISGSRADVLPYLRHLAARAPIAAVGLDYTIAPEAVAPTAIRQLDEALGYLVAHAVELGIDPDRIVLAGDSAGAQLASQLAALTVDPEYARILGLRASLRPHQLRGVVLHCGIYDLPAMRAARGIVGWGFRSALRAVTGSRRWLETPAGAAMSTIELAGPDVHWPPVFVSGGDADGLTALQSVPLADRLRAAGHDVTALFWPGDPGPRLPHEYQFHLDLPDARRALQQTVGFVARVTE
ncbi:hypothetical protein GCM10009851_16800 [Herbiconiux moechotypicola]|uniref:Alpha/beta hydrolase fold-3 domain-containing protein n=1 Tax=Herbiconiux moechotypicola TaxID=637393 RepID=A0ABP5QFM7_9MICO